MGENDFMSRNARLLHDDDLRQLLVDKGLRVTAQRMEIVGWCGQIADLPIVFRAHLQEALQPC